MTRRRSSSLFSAVFMLGFAVAPCCMLMTGCGGDSSTTPAGGEQANDDLRSNLEAEAAAGDATAGGAETKDRMP